MSKYIFKKVPEKKDDKARWFDPDTTIVKMTVEGDKTWPDLMQDFVHFLNGCGYQVPAGEWIENDNITYSLGDNQYEEGEGEKQDTIYYSYNKEINSEEGSNRDQASETNEA